MQVFPVSTVEPAERFTRLTTTVVRAGKTTLANTVRTVSHFSLSVRFPLSDISELHRGLGWFSIYNQSINWHRHIKIIALSLVVKASLVLLGWTETKRAENRNVFIDFKPSVFQASELGLYSHTLKFIKLGQMISFQLVNVNENLIYSGQRT